MWPTIFKIPWLDIPIRGYGLMLMIGFLGGTWWGARRAARVKGDPDLVVNIGFVSLIASIIGARIFYVVHYWDSRFAGHGFWPIVDITAGGLEFYGGFIGAVIAGVGYIWFTGRSVRLYLDILAPSIMFGMAMARIGCFLNGCCWGGFCSPEVPWAVQFPYASPAFCRQFDERQVTAPAELMYINAAGEPYPIPRDLLQMTPEERESSRLAYEQAKKNLEEAKLDHADAKTLTKLEKKLKNADEERRKTIASLLSLEQTRKKFDLTYTEMADLAEAHRSRHVHPVQLYASIDGMLLALLLNAYFHRRKRHGMVFAMLLLTYPFVRIVEEIIRIDNPHDSAGLTISQFVSVLLVIAGIAMVYALRRMPMRSPKAVPCVYEEPEAKKKKK